MKTTIKIISNPKTEAEHQRNIFAWSELHREEYPELKYLAHVKNEEKTGAKEVAIDRANGVRKGFPDLILPIPRGGYGCCMIELKTEKGRASDAQKWWVEHMNAEGNFAEICHGWTSAVRVLEWYLSLGRSDNAPT